MKSRFDVITVSSLVALFFVSAIGSLGSAQNAPLSAQAETLPARAATGPSRFDVAIAAPTLISVWPSPVEEGKPTVITLTGTGFESASTVQLNGITVSSAYVSSTTLTADLTASNLAQAGSDQLKVVNPSAGGGPSDVIVLSVTQPVPVIQSVEPASILVGAGAVTVTITGSDFASAATVSANGSPLAITARTSTSITTRLSAPSVAQTGSISLIVTNPGVNEESSGAESIAVVTTPTIYQLSPTVAALGSPDQTINVYGTNFAPNSVVQWNGTAVSTTYQSSGSLQAIVPAADMATFNSASIRAFTPVGDPAKPGFVASSSLPFSTYLNLPNNDLAYNPVDGLLYASVPGAGPGDLANCVVGFDPLDGNIVKRIPVGSEPGKIAISSDGARLFVGLNGAASVREVNLVTARAGIQSPLGPTTVVGTPTTVEALAAVPGETNSVAVFDNDGTVTIFDSGVPRAKDSFGITNGYVNESSGSLSFGSSASTLYVSSYLGGLYALDVNATGVISGKTLSTNVEGGYQIQYDKGRLYLSNGAVLDAATAKQLGKFSENANQAVTGPVVSDSTLGLAFIAAANMQPQLLAFREATFTPAGSIPLGNGGFQKIVRWGQDGLAASNATQIFVVQSRIVKDLSSSPADLAVAIRAPAAAVTGSPVTWTATVTNKGPAEALGISFNSMISGSVIVHSARASYGACAGSNQVSCDLGSLARGATTTVTVTGVPSTSGSVTSTATVSSISYDPVEANNQTASSTTVTGSLFSAVPQVSAISPSLVRAGSADFTLTVIGNGFNADSVVRLNGQTQHTAFVSSTQLTAEVNAAAIADYGWTPVTVSNPSPGGGISQVVPLTTYALVNVPANGILFDPFTRKIYATLPGDSNAYKGNSIVAIDPATAKVGKPVSVGKEPDIMAETSDGKYLYVGLSGANSLAQFNLLNQTVDATIPLTLEQFGYGRVAVGSMAAMPGSDSTLAISTAGSGHLGIFDVSGKSGSFRPDLIGGSSPFFLDAAQLDLFSDGLDQYSVGANGLKPIGSSALGTNLVGFSGFGPQTPILAGHWVYGVGGGIANPFSTPPSQVAILNTYGGYGLAVAPDAATSTDFVLLEEAAGTFGYGLYRYNTTQFLAEDQLSLPVAADGQELGYDMLRWGQDGLALRSYGDFGNSASRTQILLIRGPFVLPSELSAHSAPKLTSAKPASLDVNGGNTALSLTGTGFIPGAVALWNGSQRTTEFINSTSLAIDIAASDLKSAGSAVITVQNPGSTASGPLKIAIK